MNCKLTRPAHIPTEQWERAVRDFETYRRELPNLLQQGHAGRYAVIKGDQVLGIWDTIDDALQAADDRFGAEPVATFKINPLDIERFALMDARSPAEKEMVCPS